MLVSWGEETMIGLQELLQPRGLDLSTRIKMARHQEKGYDMNALLSASQFDVFQAFQRKPVFECDSVVSFIAEDGTRARLVGVYHVAGRRDPGSTPVPAEFLYRYMDVSHNYFYELKCDSRFDDLARRVVVDWGARTWHQWFVDREVLEVLPRGYVKEFPGYLDFVLNYPELVEIVEHPAANREWHQMLRAVAGIYLITDQQTGDQYVGSAYGAEGVLGRWRTYTAQPHGGNLRLRELLEQDSNRHRGFQFTLLRTLDKSLSKNEVFAVEATYKRKLGSRVFGLNAN